MSELAQCPECGSIVWPGTDATAGLATFTDDASDEETQVIGTFHADCWPAYEAKMKASA